MRSRYFLAAAALLGCLLTAAPALASVHPGDELFVTVYDHPELTGPLSIDSTNHISMPLIGPVDVRGLDTNQIASRVQSSLVAYVIRPAVNVQLKTQLPVLFISGGPGGTLAYEPGETLIAALGTLAPRMQDPFKVGAATANQSATFTDLERSRLDLSHVGIVRNDKALGNFNALKLSTQGTGGPELQAGDTLTIANKPLMVHVNGDVAQPGDAYLDRSEPLSDALTQVGGLLPSASTSQIQLNAAGVTQTIAQGDPRWSSPATNGLAVTVPTAPRINVAGLVNKPGQVALKTDTSLLTALYEAGGPTQWADLKNVQIMQNGTRVSYDITQLVHGNMTQNPQLHDGDSVFVPEGHKINPNIFQTIFNSALLLKFL